MLHSGQLMESQVDEVVLGWLVAGCDCQALFGPSIAPGEAAAERADPDETVLVGRLTAALARLNPTLPSSAIEEAVRRILHRDSPSLIANNQVLHRMLVDGVQVDIPCEDGGIRGEAASA